MIQDYEYHCCSWTSILLSTSFGVIAMKSHLLINSPYISCRIVMIQQTWMTQYKPVRKKCWGVFSLTIIGVVIRRRCFFSPNRWSCWETDSQAAGRWMFNPLLFIHRLNNPSPAVDVKNLGGSQLLRENGKNSKIMLNPDWTKAVPLVCRKKTCKTHRKLRESPPFAQTWCRFPGRYRARPGTQPEFAAGHQHFFWRIIATGLILEGKSKDILTFLGFVEVEASKHFTSQIPGNLATMNWLNFGRGSK